MVSKLPVFTVALILGLCDVLAVIAAWSLKETMGKPMDDELEESSDGDGGDSSGRGGAEVEFMQNPMASSL